MAKRSNQKLKLLYLAKIFIEKTDNEHRLTLAQILEELERYGIYAERKTVYDDMEALRIFGINVCSSRDKSVRYYISQSAVDFADIKIIYDLLVDCGLFNETKINELLKKIPKSNAAIKEIKKISAGAVLCENTYNNALYENLQSICEAILNNRKIKFKYFDWNSYKQRIILFDGEFINVDPISVRRDGKRYLIYALNVASNEIESFFVDRMINVSVCSRSREITDEMCASIEFDKRENVRLYCENCTAGELFNKFGLNVTILANREEYFEVSLKADIDENFYSWVFAQQGKVKILSPVSAQEKYMELLEENLKRLN